MSPGMAICPFSALAMMNVAINATNTQYAIR